MKAIIKKSKAYGECVIFVDDVDFLRIEKCSYKICLHNSPSGMYVKVRNVLPDNHRKKFFLHRLIMDVIDENIYVDHRDGNGLNNVKSNLRKCSPSQNSMNRPKTTKNKIGYKGVYKTPDGYFAVRIGVGKSKFYGGRFDTPEKAAEKYNELSRQYHGEFAYQNPL
jgi:hypothetical protein